MNKNVIKKLYSEVEINLSLADDLQSVMNDAKARLKQKEDAINWAKKAENAQKIISDAHGILKASNKANTKFLEETVSIYNNIDRKAQELGIKPELINGYKEALKLIYEVQNTQNEITGWIEEISKYKV